MMALIPCPECNRAISETATFCPNCGYVTTKGKEDKSIRNRKNGHKAFDKKKGKEVFEKTSDALVYIFTLQWIEDLSDWLYDIPLVGPVLSVVVKYGLALGLLVGVFVGGGALISYFYSIAPELTIVIGVVASNVFHYFVTTNRFEKRKWFFVMWLFLSIAILLFVFQYEW